MAFQLIADSVRRTVPDMKTLTTRDLNRKTADVLKAVEHGETFELRRNGKTVGYLTRTAPARDSKPDWNAHFEWLRKQKKRGPDLVRELDQERKRLRARERAMGNLQ